MPERTILTLKIRDVDSINDMIMQSFPGEATTLLSADSKEETPENARLFGGQQISQDFLNKIAPSGMLPHKLTLKEGAPVMPLRNMHGACGQANGTRMLSKIHSRVIEAEIVAGRSIDNPASTPTQQTQRFHSSSGAGNSH